MNKWSFWKKDWFVGLLVALVFLSGANNDLMQSLERKAYDWGVLASSRTPSDRIAVIAIDDQSIANLGRWPWPREIHARMIDILASGHAKVVGHTAFFFEPQVDAGLIYIHKIAELLGRQSLLNGAMPGGAASAAAAVPAQEGILVLPGALFETPGFFRICLTATEETCERSLPGFAAALTSATASWTPELMA